MITSALILQLRREFNDMPKTHRAQKAGDGTTTVFNVGEFPVIEGSYSVYKGTSGQTETSHYTLDLDNGDLQFVTAPGANIVAKVDYKHAEWRDKNWVEAINKGIDALNGLGFFKQIVRDTSVLRISAGVQSFSGPTNCVDLYELLESDDYTISGHFRKLQTNWSYQQDGNKVVLGGKPTVANRLAASYLRNLLTYSATSATLDVKDEWIELIKEKAGEIFYKSLAGKYARQSTASADERPFQFSNLRSMALDCANSFQRLALRKKPTRPAKDIQWHIDGGGVA